MAKFEPKPTNLMNKFFLFGLAIVFSSQMYSQKHEISAGMGLGSTVQLLDEFWEFGAGFSAVFFNTSYVEKTENLGEFRISYAYTPKQRWSFGAAFSYNQSKFDVFRTDEKIGNQVNNYYTLAAETRIAFLQKEQLRLYALMGVGATFGQVKRSHWSDGIEQRSQGTLFNFQITPFGVRYGKDWGGFAELGFGYRGLLSFGIFYRL